MPHAVSRTDPYRQAASPKSAASTLRAWWRALVRRRLLKRTVYVLEGLDDRTLKDIGLDRSEIRSIAATGCIDRRVRCVWPQ